jgi:hypothetical protein
MLSFNAALERCRNCHEDWHKANTLNSWYKEFQRWVASKECTHQPGGIKTMNKIVWPQNYYPCLWEWLDTDGGDAMKGEIIFSNATEPEDRRIIAYR